eukprot:PITA_35872
MYNDESVANYFLCIDEIVNCMNNLGEEIKEVVVVEKVLRSLSSKFESKVSAIEEKENLQKITMLQLHGILSAYEMRKGGPSNRREATFKASGKGDSYDLGHISEEEEESNFVKNLQRGAGRLKGKLPFKCFACGRVGNYAAKCPHKVGLRKEIEKTKAPNLRFVKGSETLDEIIKVQRSPLIKTGLGYNEEASQAQKPSTSKSYIDAARRSEQIDNQQQRHNAAHQVSARNSEGASLKYQNMENEITTTKKMWYSVICIREGKSMVHRQWMFKTYDSQLCDQETEVISRSNGCSGRDLDIGETMIKGLRTLNNLYIFKEGQQQCYLSKNDENWLWDRRLGHLSFSQIRKAWNTREFMVFQTSKF